MKLQERSEEATRTDVEVVRDRADLPRLRAVWDGLAAADRRDGLFRGYAWNVLWLRHVAPHAVPHVLTVARNGEIVGLASLCETVYADRGFRLRSLGFTGRETVTGDFLDVLAAPGCGELVRDALFAHLEEELGRRPFAVLGECLLGSSTADRAARWLSSARRRARWQEERTCPFIELPGSFDAYLGSLSRNMRSNLKRRMRQLDEAGCETVRLRGAAEVLPQLEVLFRLHESRWREEGQAGTFGRPGFRQFLRAFIEEAEPLATAELYLLRDAAGPFASLLFFRWGDAVLFYQGGWDPRSPHARLSPGLALFGRSIADAIDDGCRWFEFLQGDESYKRKFTATERRTATLLVAGRGLLPRAYLAAMSLKDRVKAAARRRKGNGEG